MKLCTTPAAAPVVGDPDDFWLVQRLSANPHPRDTAVGLDRAFSLDYMGSTEFELGAQFRSLKVTRASGHTGIHVHEATRGAVTRPVYFIGAEQHFAQATASFDLWFTAERLAGQEMSFFDTKFEPAGDGLSYRDRVVAWWAFDVHMFFTLSHDEAVKLLAAIDSPPAT